MTQPKVSIIIPCYNGEKTLQRLIESILFQTHKNLQIIFVNDGSTDGSLELIIKNKPRFDDFNHDLVIVDQENKGVGVAINSGLQHVDGKYLCWIDSDDYYEPRSIEKRVGFLELNQGFGSVTSNGFIYRHPNYTKPIGLSGDNLDNHNPNQFELLLIGRSTFIPAAHMISMKALRDVNPKLSIYPARRGQNWQLLLPVYYKYNRAYIDEPLFNYVIYENSMSRGDDTFEKKLARHNEHEEILLYVIQSIKMKGARKASYLLFTKLRYKRIKMYEASLYNNRKLVLQFYQELKEATQVNVKDRLFFIFAFFPLGYKFKHKLQYISFKLFRFTRVFSRSNKSYN
jgi:glycosyltransferase involved in cell wall biosynthesis